MVEMVNSEGDGGGVCGLVPYEKSHKTKSMSLHTYTRRLPDNGKANSLNALIIIENNYWHRTNTELQRCDWQENTNENQNQKEWVGSPRPSAYLRKGWMMEEELVICGGYFATTSQIRSLSLINITISPTIPKKKVIQGNKVHKIRYMFVDVYVHIYVHACVCVCPYYILTAIYINIHCIGKKKLWL